MKQVFLVALCSALSGCGLPWVSSSNGAVVSSLSYEFKDNERSCSTGYHKADFQSEYCEMLGNHFLNNYCAYEARREAYRNSCGIPNFEQL
ncbi:MAG: hypothetical protein HYR96_01630 [Deltaproteobacteria bacterium]|nr:hypothetical protein [Deltaproteobacteria bacterium]MBI3295982.1 hypothetical protein [Deltaproteobacteria bacterium]